VSSESDLQRYRAITFHKNPSADTKTSSSISNVPSDSTGKTRVSQKNHDEFFCAYEKACIIFFLKAHSCFFRKESSLDDKISTLVVNDQKERFTQQIRTLMP
jgi:hypothetical protein